MLQRGLVVLAGVCLVIVQFSLPEHPIYDEAHYLRNSVMMANGDVGRLEFEEHFGPTGPGYAWVHSIGTNFEPMVRLPRVFNLVLFLASIVILAFDSKKGWDLSSVLVLLCFPGIWVSASLALTEMYSVFCISVGLGLLRWFHNRGRFADGLLWAGLLFGLAVFSRQTLISLALPFGLFFIAEIFQNKRFHWQGVLGIVFILGSGLTMFVNWKGLLPNDGHPEHYAQTGFLSVRNFLIAANYVLASSALLFFKGHWIQSMRDWITQNWQLFVVTFIGIFAVIHLTSSANYVPLRGALESVVSPRTLDVFGELFAAFSVFAVAVVVSWTLKKAVKLDYQSFLKNHLIEIFAGLSAMAVILTTLAITHQFSSRYVVMCAPFVAAMMWGKRTWGLGSVSLLAMNALSITSYFLL